MAWQLFAIIAPGGGVACASFNQGLKERLVETLLPISPQRCICRLDRWGCAWVNILHNGQLQEVQEGVLYNILVHRGRGMVPVPKSGEGGWNRAISG